MPTCNRPDFVRRAVECFEAQSYSPCELVVIDDGDPVEALLPPGAVYVQCPTMTVGAKRNAACHRAKGELIVHWDDDDESAPERIADQVARIQNSRVQITGYHTLDFVTETGERWRYSGMPGYAIGTSMMYWKSFWKTRAFPDVRLGEDWHFQQGAGVYAVDGGDMILCHIHARQTNPTSSVLDAKEWTKL